MIMGKVFWRILGCWIGEVDMRLSEVRKKKTKEGIHLEYFIEFLKGPVEILMVGLRLS
jgi:hypothetical protein